MTPYYNVKYTQPATGPFWLHFTHGMTAVAALQPKRPCGTAMRSEMLTNLGPAVVLALAPPLLLLPLVKTWHNLRAFSVLMLVPPCAESAHQLRRKWQGACSQEKVSPHKPHKA